MDSDALFGFGILAFVIVLVYAALRDKSSRDANNHIIRFSKAWWVIFFVVPFGQLWCLARAFEAPAPREIPQGSQEPQEGGK